VTTVLSSHAACPVTAEDSADAEELGEDQAA
jgi:hypothetical protein